MRHTKRTILDGRAIVRAYKRTAMLGYGKRATTTEIKHVLDAIDATIEALDYVDEDDFDAPPAWGFDSIEDVFA